MGSDIVDAETLYMAANMANSDEMLSRHNLKNAQTEIGFNFPTGFENRARKVSP